LAEVNFWQHFIDMDWNFWVILTENSLVKVGKKKSNRPYKNWENNILS